MVLVTVLDVLVTTAPIVIVIDDSQWYVDWC